MNAQSSYPHRESYPHFFSPVEDYPRIDNPKAQLLDMLFGNFHQPPHLVEILYLLKDLACDLAACKAGLAEAYDRVRDAALLLHGRIHQLRAVYRSQYGAEDEQLDYFPMPHTLATEAGRISKAFRKTVKLLEQAHGDDEELAEFLAFMETFQQRLEKFEHHAKRSADSAVNLSYRPRSKGGVK